MPCILNLMASDAEHAVQKSNREGARKYDEEISRQVWPC